MIRFELSLFELENKFGSNEFEMSSSRLEFKLELEIKYFLSSSMRGVQLANLEKFVTNILK